MIVGIDGGCFAGAGDCEEVEVASADDDGIFEDDTGGCKGRESTTAEVWSEDGLLGPAVVFRSTTDVIAGPDRTASVLRSTADVIDAGVAGLRSTTAGPVGSLGDDRPSVSVGVPASDSVALAKLLTVRCGIRASLNLDVFGFEAVVAEGSTADELDGGPLNAGLATAVLSPSSTSFFAAVPLSGAPYAASRALTSASDRSSIVAPMFSTSPLLIASSHLRAFSFSSSSPKSSSSSEAHGGATSLSFPSTLPVRIARAKFCWEPEGCEELEEGSTVAPRDCEGVLRGRVVL